MGQVADISIPTGVVRPVLDCDVIQVYRIPSRLGFAKCSGCSVHRCLVPRDERKEGRKGGSLRNTFYSWLPRSERNFIPERTNLQRAGPRFPCLESSPMIRVRRNNERGRERERMCVCESIGEREKPRRVLTNRPFLSLRFLFLPLLLLLFFFLLFSISRRDPASNSPECFRPISRCAQLAPVHHHQKFSSRVSSSPGRSPGCPSCVEFIRDSVDR